MKKRFALVPAALLALGLAVSSGAAYAGDFREFSSTDPGMLPAKPVAPDNKLIERAPANNPDFTDYQNSCTIATCIPLHGSFRH